MKPDEKVLLALLGMAVLLYFATRKRYVRDDITTHDPFIPGGGDGTGGYGVTGSWESLRDPLL